MECISLDVKNNWALKLGNLRRLKKALDKYLEEELKISNSRFDRIDLPNLARKGNPDEIIKLFESIFYAIVNCPEKRMFVEKIMELEESAQISLMFFIQKIIGEDENNPIQDSELFKKEMEMLKNEKKKLSKQVFELGQELSSTIEEKNRIQTNMQQLKAENERLYRDIDRKSIQEERISIAVMDELRNRINEKDEAINECQRSFDKIKKQYEAEIAQLKDDLDIATAKAYQNMNSDKTLQQYKKRLESLAGIKQKAADLQKQNENLMETVASQHSEIELLIKSKKQITLLKEQVSKEKNRADTLSFNLESKEKNLKKLEKEIIECREKITKLEIENEELMNERQDSSHGSEESFGMQHEKLDIHIESQNSQLIKFQTSRSINARKSCLPTALEQIDVVNKDLNYQKSIVKAKKMRLKAYKETVKMCLEELRTRSYEYEGKISQLEGNNLILSDQIQIISENLAEKENDKIIHEQTMYELEEVKATKVTLLSDIKMLYSEKDAIHKKYMDGREEFFALQAKVNGKDMEIRELGLEIKLFQDKIQAYEEKEKIFKQELSSLKRNSMSSSHSQQGIFFESEVIALKNENAELQQRLDEKTDRINQVIASKEEAIQKLQKENEEKEEKYKQELEIKSKEFMAQSEEAVNVLLQQREQLVAKLQFERRNTMIGWQRAMSIKDPTQLVSEEIYRLRETLVEKEKEIARISKNNKELKICWKDSAKLLKAVWKQLGDETKKIEEAVKKRHQ